MTPVPPVTAETVPRTMRFGRLEIAYDERVLEPRAWTAAQSTWSAEILAGAPAGPVLELCCGAGQIGLLTVALTPRELVCVDLSPQACALARHNADAALLDRPVSVRQGAIDEVLHDGETFALVVADPPWVRSAETGRFPADPLLAIDGGDDGLHVAWSCVRAASRHLVPGGSCVLQLGTVEQAERVGAGLTSHGDLGLTEVREFERGVLARLDLPR